MRAFHARRLAPLAVLRYHGAAATALAFAPAGGLIASAARDRSVALWSLF